MSIISDEYLERILPPNIYDHHDKLSEFSDGYSLISISTVFIFGIFMSHNCIEYFQGIFTDLNVV